jgi:hypothetical protein
MTRGNRGHERDRLDGERRWNRQHDDRDTDRSGVGRDQHDAVGFERDRSHHDPGLDRPTRQPTRKFQRKRLHAALEPQAHRLHALLVQDRSGDQARDPRAHHDDVSRRPP